MPPGLVARNESKQPGNRTTHARGRVKDVEISKKGWKSRYIRLEQGQEYEVLRPSEVKTPLEAEGQKHQICDAGGAETVGQHRSR